jgi:hypothetical protein
MSLKNIVARPKPVARNSNTNRPDARQQAVVDRQNYLDTKISGVHSEQRRLLAAENVAKGSLKSNLESRRNLNTVRLDKLEAQREKYRTQYSKKTT